MDIIREGNGTHSSTLAWKIPWVVRQFFPYLDTVHVTKIDAAPFSDSYFPNLDEDPGWVCSDAEPEQEHDGVKYQFCVYKKVKQA